VTARIAPSTLTETSVSRPANIKELPSAMVKGHPVGAGISMNCRAGFSTGGVFSVLMKRFPARQRVMKYTTDSTTTQMASTKCQYIANTPMRPACSRFTKPKIVKIRMIVSPVAPTITWKA